MVTIQDKDIGDVLKGLDYRNRKEYTSKTKRGECANSKCTNPRRDSSKYCQACSENHIKKVNK